MMPDPSPEALDAPASPMVTAVELLPAEAMSLTVALAQVLRGEDPTPNIASVCVLALARLAGRHDWTVEMDG